LVEVAKLQKRLGKLGYTISLDDSVIDYITKVGFDEVYGARSVKKSNSRKD